MNLIRRILNFGALLMFVLCGGLVYAFVFDCEPISDEKRYSLEREVFARTNDDWSRDFPNFADWLSERDHNEAKFREWMQGLSTELGYQCAETFDPTYQRPYQDTREGHAAEAPGNWNNGRDD